MSHLLTIHVNPVFVPILAVKSTQDEDDVFSLSHLWQRKPMTKPAIAIILDLFVNAPGAVKFSQQQVLGGTPSCIGPVLELVAAFKSLLLLGGDRMIIRTK